MKTDNEPEDNELESIRRRIEIKQAFRELEKEGRIVKSGKYRRDSRGILQPVYVTREVYERMKRQSQDTSAGSSLTD